MRIPAAVEGGAVGVKTICAYRASLKLQPVDTDALGIAFSALKLRVGTGQQDQLDTVDDPTHRPAADRSVAGQGR